MLSSPWKQSTGQTATQSVKRQRLQLSVTTKVMAPSFLLLARWPFKGVGRPARLPARSGLLEGRGVAGAGAQHLGPVARKIDHGGGLRPARAGVDHQAQTGKLLLQLTRVRGRDLAVPRRGAGDDGSPELLAQRQRDRMVGDADAHRLARRLQEARHL